MEKKYSDVTGLLLLTGEIDERSAEIILKFNAALARLAEERNIDKEELLAEETTYRKDFGLAKLATRSPTSKNPS